MSDEQAATASKQRPPLRFVDRYHLQRVQGLTFQMHQPVKERANPILTPQQDWEGWRSFPYGKAVLFDPTDGCYKLWYETQHDGASSGSWEMAAIKRMAYATSHDGLHWERPNLGQVTRAGSTRNSLIDMGPFGMHFANVILDEEHDPDPARRFKMLFWAMPPGKGTGELPMGATVAASADGVRWRLLRPPHDPAFPGRAHWAPGKVTAGDAVSLVGWVAQQQRYVAFLKSNDLVYQGYRTICYSESVDFINWSKLVSVLAPDEYDPWGAEFYYMTVFPYPDLAGTLYVGLLSVYHNYTRRRGAWGEATCDCPPELAHLDQHMDVRLAFSRDLQVWQQAGGRAPFVPLGAPGAWDSGVIYGSTLLDQGDETWLYYAGTPMRHLGDDLQQAGTVVNGQWWGIFGGVARLRREGFVSLHAGAEAGEAVTQPLRLSGQPLLINACTQADGAVQVQLLDAAGHTLAGLAEARFTGDEVAGALAFPPAQLAALQGEAVRIRVTCHSADLYSLTV